MTTQPPPFRAPAYVLVAALGIGGTMIATPYLIVWALAFVFWTLHAVTPLVLLVP